MLSFRTPKSITALMVAALLLYGALLIGHAYYSVWGADASAYVNIARSILEGRIIQPAAGLDQLELPDKFVSAFAPLGYEAGPRPRAFSPIYPVGYPLHMAGGALLFGWKYGPFLVSPVAALLSLALIYLVGLELGLSRGLSFAGAAILALNPTFCLYAIQPMSDGLATCWSLAAVLAAVRSRRRDLWGLAAGAAFGLAFLVRPTSVLLLPAVFLGLRLTPRVLSLFLLGGLPFAGVFFAYNLAAYGRPLTTGYAAIGLQSLVMLSDFTVRFRHYVYWLVVTMSPLPLLGWAALSLDRKAPARDRALLLVWFGSFFLFYCCYFFYAEWWYTRFLLPAAPALILGTLIVFRDLVARVENKAPLRGGPWARRVAVAFLLVIVLGFERQSVERFRLLRVAALDRAHADACQWADRALPQKALVVSMEMSGALKFYTGRPVVRYERVDVDQWPLLQARAAAKGYDWYALLMSQEIEEARRRLPGKWTQMGALRQISLWRIEPASN